MKKFKYSTQDLAKIMSILQANDVKLEFKDFNKLYKSLEDIAPVIHSAYENWKYKQYKTKSLDPINFLNGA